MMPKPTTITYYYRGDVERGTGAGYRWTRGYSAVGEGGGGLYPWSTKAECRDEAEAEGKRAVFVEDWTDTKPPMAANAERGA